MKTQEIGREQETPTPEEALRVRCEAMERLLALSDRITHGRTFADSAEIIRRGRENRAHAILPDMECHATE
jgi:hypothetical protein